MSDRSSTSAPSRSKYTKLSPQNIQHPDNQRILTNILIPIVVATTPPIHLNQAYSPQDEHQQSQTSSQFSMPSKRRSLVANPHARISDDLPSIISMQHGDFRLYIHRPSRSFLPLSTSSCKRRCMGYSWIALAASVESLLV